MRKKQENKIKEDELKVPSKVLNNFGAVSEEVVSIIAKNIRNIFNSDKGLF